VIFFAVDVDAGLTLQYWLNLESHIMVLKKHRQYRLALISKLTLILLLGIEPDESQCSPIFTETIGKGLTVVHGAVNGVLLDRNGKGYLQCLDQLNKMPSDVWLINQHVKPAFRFSSDQIRMMEDTLQKRFILAQTMTVWGNPNCALDESWAHLYPYFQQAQSGTTSRCILKLMNHSETAQTFQATINLPQGWTLKGISPGSVVVPPQHEGCIEVLYTPARESPAGLYILTADIKYDQRDLRAWCEAMVTIAP